MKLCKVYIGILLSFVFIAFSSFVFASEIQAQGVVTARTEKEQNLWMGWKDAYSAGLSKGTIIVDPFSNTAFSEAMAHALILAVQFSDQVFFDSILDGLYSYFANDNGLFAWKVKATGRQYGDISISASETEINVLFALLQAQKLVDDGVWKADKNYLALAKTLEKNVWEFEIFKSEDNFFLLPSDEKKNPYWPFLKNGSKIKAIAWAPTYFNPAYFKEFAIHFPEHDWTKVTSFAYELMDNILYNSDGLLANDLGVKGLNPVPAWIYLSFDAKGKFVGFGNYFAGQKYEGNRYSNEYDSVRVPIYIGLDWIWNKDKRAKDFLTRFVDIAGVKRISQTFSGASPEHAKGFCDPLATGSYGVANSVVRKSRGKYFMQALERRISFDRKCFGRDPSYAQYYYNQTLCLYAYLILNDRFEKILD